MTKCPKCKFYSICGGRLNETVANCVRFKSTEYTNEEWFDGLSTEEKAKEFVAIQLQERDPCEVITDKMIQSCFNRWKEWLKQPHTTE